MIQREQAVATAKHYSLSRNGTWDDNHYSCKKVTLQHEPCWKISHISGNNTDDPWYEMVSGTPVDYYISMVTGEVIGIMGGRGGVIMLNQMVKRKGSDTC